MKRCPVCERLLAEEAFAWDTSRKDGLANKCKACQRDYYNRVWYPANAARKIKQTQRNRADVRRVKGE